ncbi:MAG: hypothetical protein ACPGXL_10445, partial [Chitinophagales bacterium]
GQLKSINEMLQQITYLQQNVSNINNALPQYVSSVTGAATQIKGSSPDQIERQIRIVSEKKAQEIKQDVNQELEAFSQRLSDIDEQKADKKSPSFFSRLLSSKKEDEFESPYAKTTPTTPMSPPLMPTDEEEDEFGNFDFGEDDDFGDFDESDFPDDFDEDDDDDIFEAFKNRG